MNNRRQTKRALLTSIMALVMCVVMLAGTTFAWFTDTASTNVNTIQAGTLKLKLEVAKAWDENGNPTEWTDVTSEPLNFLQKKSDGTVAQSADILWEPGATYDLPELRISNDGNLALKYKIEIKGIGGDEDLNKVIDWTMTMDDSTTALGTEHHLAAKVGNTVDADVLTISGHMQETAGNTYMGKEITNVSIKVVATQDTVEFDSYTDKYDENADYPEVQPVTSLDSLKDALASDDINGKTIKLYDDVDAEKLNLSDKNVALDLNGKTLSADKLEVKNSTIVLRDSSESGNGKIETDDSYGVINAVNSKVTIESGNYVSSYNKSGSSGYASVIQVRNSELTINGGYFENNDNVGGYNYLIKAPSYSRTVRTTITINGGEIVSHRDYGYIVAGDSDANVDVVINGGIFKTTGRNSYLTNVKGSVVVNDCTFTAEGNNTVFNIPANSTVTVRGGTFSVNENSYTDPSLAGLIFHRKTNGWTSVSGTLLVDPVTTVKVNQETYSGFLAAGATQSGKGADGFYTITKS